MTGQTPQKNWYALVADLGGTKARFALVDSAKCCQHVTTFDVLSFDSADAAIAAYLKQMQVCCPAIVGIAVAAPTEVELINLTNSHWQFNPSELKSSLGCKELLIINDFTALAHAVATLKPQHIYQIGTTAARANGNLAVLGAGTGFGVAGVLWHNQQWIPLSGEGGHIEWAPVGPLERELQQYLLKTHQRLSIEKILQGKGLMLLYQAICQVHQQPQTYKNIAAVIAHGSSMKCIQCHTTLTIYCKITASVAGDIALLFGARGGVYLGGGIIPKLIEVVNPTQFRESFENKGRLASYNQKIPSFIITKATPTLDGMAIALAARDAMAV